MAVKRRLWHDLLRTALGEVVEGDEFDDLFVRHTYLTMVVGIVVQATFGMDVSRIAETDAEDLLRGRQFAEATGSAWRGGVGLFLVADRGWGDAIDKDDCTTGCAFRLVVAAFRHCGDVVSDGDSGVSEASRTSGSITRRSGWRRRL